jgi:hypothetical protein
MAKNKETENPTDDKVMLDGIPGADKKTAEDAEGFKVDLNFEEEPKAEEEEVEFPKEAEVEEVEELKAEEEPSEETEEATETEEPEAEPAVAENEGEETVLADDGADTQELEETTKKGTDGETPKEPMIPKSRFDEVLAKQRALTKQLEEATNPKEIITEAPEYDFEAKEMEYQDAILNGDPKRAAVLRSEMRDAEKKQMMFEVQNKMGETVQQSTEVVALQAKAAELASTFPVLDETHADFNKETTQEVLDLRDAFITQGYTGADALDKAAKYVVGSAPTPTPEPKKDVVGEKIVQKKKVANTTKKLEAAESQPPALKGKNKVEKKIDLDVLSSEEFDALPEETLKRMRGDFG